MVLNLGSMFLALIFMLTLPACFVCVAPCRKVSPKCNRRFKGTTAQYHGNVWIRFMMEGGLDIAICAALNYIFILETTGGLQWDSTFQIVNNVSILTTIVILNNSQNSFRPLSLFLSHFRSFITTSLKSKDLNL